jgi:hypothetical protein
VRIYGREINLDIWVSLNDMQARKEFIHNLIVDGHSVKDGTRQGGKY